MSGLALLGAERPAVKDLETLTGVSILSDGLVPDHEYVFEFKEKKKKKKKERNYKPSVGQAIVDVGIVAGTRGRVRRRYAEADADSLHEYARYSGLIKGAKKVSHFPPQEEFCLYHPKNIKRQERQNKLYENISNR